MVGLPVEVHWQVLDRGVETFAALAVAASVAAAWTALPLSLLFAQSAL